jgi:very-short-patch-repair endonuclease
MAKHTDGYLEKYNWIDIQKFYDDGNSWAEVVIRFNITSSGLDFGLKSGVFKTRSKSDANKLAHLKKPRKLSSETKLKISESRIKFLKENPDKVPYKLNHSSKESFPEKYFTEIFEKEGIKVEKYYHIGLYELDFCIPEKKIDIEIDGNQHYDDKKIVESDKRRTAYLEDNGWDVIRIRWSDYNKLLYDEKLEFVKTLKKYLNNLINEKPNINSIVKKDNLCDFCGVEVTKGNNRCQKCYRIDSRKVERPSLVVLLKDIEELGYCGTGRKYNVTDNSIRKWIKNYKNKGSYDNW